MKHFITITRTNPALLAAYALGTVAIIGLVLLVINACVLGIHSHLAI